VARTLLSRVRRTLRRTRAQRQAAAGESGVGGDRIAVVLEEAIGALTGRSVEPSWWKGAIAKARQAGIAPDPMFRGQSLWAWLDDPQVRETLRTLAAYRIANPRGSASEDSAYDLLAERYQDLVGDLGSFSRGKVAMIVAVVQAGLQADLAGDPAASALSVQLQSNLDALTALVGSQASGRPSLTETASAPLVHACRIECERQLERIFLRRSLPGVPARVEIANLASRIDTGGDLALCPKDLRGQIYYWAARLHAQDAAQTAPAQRFRQNLLDCNPDADTVVIDAWLDLSGGNAEKALQRLRDRQEPDARSNLMALIRASQGLQAAIEWFSGQDSMDPDLFTGLGWRNAAVTLAEGGDWDVAVNILGRVADKHTTECPDVFFVDGVLNAAFLCPLDLRRHMLSMPVETTPVLQEGAEVDCHRRRALAAFAKAVEAMRRLGEKERAHAAQLWITWLRLTDPVSRTDAKSELTEAMSKGETAVDAVALACIAGLEFDTGLLERYLRTRELAGGLDPPDLGAKLALYRYRKPRAELIAFLEAYATQLDAILLKGARAGLLISTLAEDGQFERANSLLQDAKDTLGPDFDRLSDFIRSRQGEDILSSVEHRFATTGALVDLLAIWDIVLRAGDLEKVRRYGLMLFQQQRTIHCAMNVAAALNNLGRFEELVSFLDGCDDLVVADAKLSALKAWALFFAGRFGEASVIVGRSVSGNAHPDIVALDINLAIASANWEHFGAILDREWARREDWPAKNLLQLGFVCARANHDRAVELAQLAAAKEPNDPQILANAYLLAVRLGREDLGAGWIPRAAELSGAEGPVRTGTAVEAMSMVSDGFRRSREISNLLAEGKLPLNVASALLNTPISRFLIVEARHNARETDWRRRSIIPLRHGGRLNHDTRSIRTITAELSSLILLADLDLLSMLDARFDHIKIPWSTANTLLTEVMEAEFHQPSRVTAARRLSIMARGQSPPIRPLMSGMTPPEWLVEQVGHELAELLEAARTAGGRLVRPLPIFEAGSLMERRAQLREYAPLILTVRQLVGAMVAHADVNHELAEKAYRYLAGADVGEPPGPDALPDGPLFLDSLTTTYLTTMDLLEEAPRLEKGIIVHPDTLNEAERLLATEDDAAVSLKALLRLQAWMKDGIKYGRISVLPASQATINREFPVPTLQEIVDNPGDSDAVVLDDRAVGQQGWLIDRSQHNLPMLGVIDLLRDFAEKGLMERSRQWFALNVLRERCFSGIPLELDELEYWLARAAVKEEDGSLRETAELRVMREYLLRLRSTTFLKQPAETLYLDRLRLAVLGAMRHAWTDPTVPLDLAVARSEWLYGNVMPSPTDWQHTIIDTSGVLSPAVGLANQISWLLPPLTDDTDRSKRHADWIENSLLVPLSFASAGVLDRVAANTRQRIEAWTQQALPEYRDALGNYMIRIQPDSIRARLIADRDLIARYGVVVDSWLSLAGTPPVRREELWNAVRGTFGDGTARRLTSRFGEVVDVGMEGRLVCLSYERAAGERHSVAPEQLQVMSPDPVVRQEAIASIVKNLGPTGPERSAWQSLVESGPLDDVLMERLSSEIGAAVPTFLGRIAVAMADGSLTAHALIPDDMRYYEALCGPKPGMTPQEQHLREAFVQYRRRLIDRAPVAGLQMCLAMCVRDDLSCVPLWDGSRDQLWSSFEQIDVRSSPFTMIGALDLALNNAEDPRFAGFADKLIGELCGPELLRSDGTDIYSVLPNLALMVNDCVRVVPGMSEQPVWWRRLCAWTHLSIVCQMLREVPLPPEFPAWCASQATEPARVSRLLELRDNPASQPGDMSRYQIRSEILGRVAQLRARFAGRGFSDSGSGGVLDQALAALPVPASYIFPGPLEGDRRPQISLAQFPEETRERFSELIDGLTPNLSDEGWVQLAYYSRLWIFDAETRAKCTQLVCRADRNDQSNKPDIRVLAPLGFIALAQSWPELSRAALAYCARLMGPALSAEEVIAFVRTALILSLALPEDSGLHELQEFLVGLAAVLQGDARAALRYELMILRYVTPAGRWRLARAEALTVP